MGQSQMSRFTDLLREQRKTAEFSGKQDRIRPVVQQLTCIKLPSHGNEGNYLRRDNKNFKKES